jgi:3-dehydroquinate synthase
VTAPLDTLSGDSSRVMVALGPRSYEIVIATGRLHDWASLLKTWLTRAWGEAPPATGKALVVSDRHVARPHAEAAADSLRQAGWQIGRFDLEPGEQAKSLTVVAQLYDALVELKADRRTLVVAVGGGVVGDSAGFAAATYARGIPFVQIPTTLLAHVDSSVGGKVGVNHPQGKNLIGAFHQPLGVFIDTATLDTLPDRDYRSGLAEVVKYGVILDGEFFAYLEAHIDGLNRRDPDVLRHVIARSCRLKADVVERDEHEITGLRAVLNYGHTFAHAYEALTGYGELMHGEAVAIGMIHASRLAERLGRIDHSITERQIALLGALHLPTSLPADHRLPIDEVIDRMRLDKKTLGGTIRFVLPSRMGQVELVDKVGVEKVRGVLDDVL